MIFLAFINIKTFFVFSIFSLPFFLNFFKSQESFLNQHSYLGEKFVGSYNLGLINYFKGIIFNYYRNFLALFYNGDQVFRHNIPGSSHLNFLMQIFLIIGFYFFIKEYFLKKPKKYFWLSIFILLIYLPTNLDVKNFLNNPSMGRTVGAISIFYPVIALGIFESIKIFKSKLLRSMFLIFILYVIFLINFYKYFYIYPKTLPQENFPLGKLTGEIIDKYPKNYPLFIDSCCWFEWGMPEPYSIIFNLKIGRNYYVNNIDYFNNFFDLIKNNDYFILITNPYNENFSYLDKNIKVKDIKKVLKNNQEMIRIYLLKE